MPPVQGIPEKVFDETQLNPNSAYIKVALHQKN
jgi:hypothetical protein